MIQYRIYHISNPPNRGFRQDVHSPAQAKTLLDLLAHYDLYLGDLIVANDQGLEVRVGINAWEEWEDASGLTMDDDDVELAQ